MKFKHLASFRFLFLLLISYSINLIYPQSNNNFSYKVLNEIYRDQMQVDIFQIDPYKSSINDLKNKYLANILTEEEFKDLLRAEIREIITFSNKANLKTTDVNNVIAAVEPSLKELNKLRDELLEEHNKTNNEKPPVTMKDYNDYLGGKLIFDNWFYDEYKQTKINIKVVVPKDFEESTAGTIKFEFYTENWQNYNIYEYPRFIHDFKLDIITNEKGFHLFDPQIDIYKSDNFEEIQDISTGLRKFKVFWGNYLPTIIGAIPSFNVGGINIPIGKSFSYSKLGVNLIEWWSSADNNDFSTLYQAQSKFDFYPMQGPRMVQNLGKPRAFRFWYKYAKLENANFMGIVIDEIATRVIDPNNQSVNGDQRYFKNISIPIYSNVIDDKNQYKRSGQNNDIELEGSETTSLYINPVIAEKEPTGLRSGHQLPHVNLKIDYKITKSDMRNEYLLHVDLEPTVIPNLSDDLKEDYKYGISIVEVSPTIEVSKSNVGIEGLPKFINYNGTEKSFITVKEENSYRFFNGIFDMMMDFLTFGTFKLVRGYEQAQSSKYESEISLAYTDQIKEQWKTANKLNVYQFPNYDNDEYSVEHQWPMGKEGCSFEFPISSLKSEIEDGEIQLVLNGVYLVAEYAGGSKRPYIPLKDKFSVELKLKKEKKEFIEGTYVILQEWYNGKWDKYDPPMHGEFKYWEFKSDGTYETFNIFGGKKYIGFTDKQYRGDETYEFDSNFNLIIYRYGEPRYKLIPREGCSQ